jgi:hypothetical protein
VTLVPSAYVENGWAQVETLPPYVVEIILHQRAPGTWSAFLVGSPDFEVIRYLIPPDFADYAAPLPPLQGAYRFPWRAGDSWWAIQGWHSGNALDFQPSIRARFGVLAAESGRMRELCSDGTQSLLEIRHADGNSTFYLHVTLGLSVRRELLDRNVERGQYLGELVRLTRFVTPCGQGLSRHLHFAVTDPSLTMDGIPLDEIAAAASCCADPPAYMSSNMRVD